MLISEANKAGYCGPTGEGEMILVAVRLNEKRAVFNKAGEKMWFSEKVTNWLRDGCC